MIRRLLREPLLHFVLLGALMFGWSAWQGGAGTSTSRIVVSRGAVDQLAGGFTRNWGREPTAAELKSLIDDHVREEVATREAVAMGLDRDDIVVRRRLRQKVEFLLADEVAAAPLSDADLKAWLARHPDAFRTEAQIAFRQVLVRPDRHGAAIDADAAAVLRRLREAGPEAAIEHLGDASMLPTEAALEPVSQVERDFGKDYAEALLHLEVGQWSGPVASSFGLHLVLVRQRVDAASPDFASVAPQVAREVQSERRAAALEALYQRLLAKYDVSVDVALPAASTVPRGTP